MQWMLGKSINQTRYNRPLIWASIEHFIAEHTSVDLNSKVIHNSRSVWHWDKSSDIGPTAKAISAEIKYDADKGVRWGNTG